jgi:RNA polymerase sigma-70 factor (family 1)
MGTTNNLETETYLLTKLKESDIGSFEQIFDLFYQKLYAFVFRYLKSKEDSEEIVQDVFIQIWENRLNLNENLSFKSYLFTITKNRIIDYFRKKKVESLYKNYVQNFVEMVHDGTYKELIYKDYDIALTEAIQQLPEKRREVFILSKKFGMSRAEIAKFFNISENTVKNQLQEALSFLRETLKKEVFIFILAIINFFS